MISDLYDASLHQFCLVSLLSEFHVFRIRGRLREHLSSSLIFLLDPFLLIVLVFCVVLLCILTFVHLCCEVRYNFRMKTMLGSSFPPVVCRRADVLFKLFVLACA